jgi:hypothetical protein
VRVPCDAPRLAADPYKLLPPLRVSLRCHEQACWELRVISIVTATFPCSSRKSDFKWRSQLSAPQQSWILAAHAVVILLRAQL